MEWEVEPCRWSICLISAASRREKVFFKQIMNQPIASYDCYDSAQRWWWHVVTTRPRCRSHMLFDGTSAWTFLAYWSEPRSHAVAGDLLITSCESSVVNYLSRLFKMISKNQVSSKFKVTMISSSELFRSRPCPWHDLWHLQPVILASLFTLVTHH